MQDVYLYTRRPFIALIGKWDCIPREYQQNKAALNMFYEYSMPDPGGLAGFWGFTEDEVAGLCKNRNQTEAYEVLKVHIHP